MNTSARIKIAQCGAAHGLRGQIKIRCFLEDASLLEHIEPITDAMGTLMRMTIIRADASAMIVAVDGITDRTQAEALRNKELFTTKDALEAALPHEVDAGEYLHQLVGLEARLEDGAVFGTVHAVYNFGASDILEIKEATTQQMHMIAYTHENVPEVYLDEGYLVVRLPEVM
jgi:16S rRNA processing protein RimM